jgi:hypothetical protein
MGHPYDLLIDQTTIFYDLVQNLNKHEQELNFDIAKENYLKKNNFQYNNSKPDDDKVTFNSTVADSNQQNEIQADIQENRPLLSNNQSE